MSVWTVNLIVDKCTDGEVETYSFYSVGNPRNLISAGQKSAYSIDCLVCSVIHLYATRIIIFSKLPTTEVGECL